MTAIAGIVNDGTVWIGGDSASVGGLSMTVRSDAKVFRKGSYVFGFTTSWRMGQLIRYSLEIPEPQGDLHEFMCTTFTARLRECLKEGGWATKTKEQEEGGTFLAGIRGRLFVIDEDYQVGESADGHAAVGCGTDLALGSLYSTRDLGWTARQRILTALEAAERYSAGVRRPFLVVNTM